MLFGLLATGLTGCGEVEAQIDFNGDDPRVVIVACSGGSLAVVGISPDNFRSSRLGDDCADTIEDILDDENLSIGGITALGGTGIIYTLVDPSLP
ncbi:MAG: hypothetical protein R3310_11855 [Candidatus Competibacteraceae bacterium]|nr:hypothetical protein [Candidatus Competibacteraceae bacterium]